MLHYVYRVFSNYLPLRPPESSKLVMGVLGRWPGRRCVPLGGAVGARYRSLPCFSPTCCLNGTFRFGANVADVNVSLCEQICGPNEVTKMPPGPDLCQLGSRMSGRAFAVPKCIVGGLRCVDTVCGPTAASVRVRRNGDWGGSPSSARVVQAIARRGRRYRAFKGPELEGLLPHHSFEMPETTIEVGAFLAGILPKDETTLLIVSMCVLAVGMTVSCVFAQKISAHEKTA